MKKKLKHSANSLLRVPLFYKFPERHGYGTGSFLSPDIPACLTLFEQGIANSYSVSPLIPSRDPFRDIVGAIR